MLLSKYQITLIGYTLIFGTKFDKDSSAVEQINYLIKIRNVYIVYDLDASPRNPTNSFELKNCCLGATSVVKNSGKEMYVYTSWSFDNDTARNVGMDSSSSS